MFTAIPTGIVSANASTGVTVASVSVYVTPQIADTSLASVAAFADWPATVAALAFAVQFRGGAADDPRADASLDPTPKYAMHRFDSTLWKAIFSPQAQVRPWSVKDFRQSGILSAQAKDVSSAVKSAYKSVASLAAKPTIVSGGTGELSKRTADIAAVIKHGPAVGAKVKSSITGTAPSLSSEALSVVPATTFVDTPEFARAAALLNRDNYRNIVPKNVQTPVVAPDFHQIIGYLADHPAILRRLGLVLDFVFTIPLGRNLDGFSTCFVVPTTPIAGLQVSHVVTQCAIHVAGSGQVPTFRPAYGDVDKVPGYPTRPVVALVDSSGLVQVDRHDVVHVDDLDIDHASVHVSNYAEKATRDLNASIAAGGPSSLAVALPALRTVGLALHHVDRERHVGLRFQDTMSWNPNGSTVVAENLVRGYRVEVREEGGAWRSLCLRNTTFTFANGAAPLSVLGDEGYVKATAMSTANDEPLHNVHESIFHWDGWSLAAARPGLSVGPSGSANGVAQEGPVIGASTGAALGMPFDVKVVPASGSLVKLRFGRSYQFRVRAVDLCGNDLRDAASDNTKDHVSPLKEFLRYEPVSPPVLQIRRPVCEGESLEHLVIRSDPYAPTPLNAEAWAAKNNVAPPGAPATSPATTGMNPYSATCERHVAPPKTSVQLAEFHAAVDAAVANVPAGQARADAAWAIVSKEEGSFNDRFVTDSTTGQYRTSEQPGRSIVTPPFSKPEVARAAASGSATFTGNQEIVPRGTALQSGQYVVFDADTVMLPYLPDANASGIAVQGLAATPLFRTFGMRAANASGGAWPELATFRLVLAESAAGVGVDVRGLTSQLSPVAGATTISLPPATFVDVTYSSTLSDPTAHAFGPASASDASHASAQRGLLPTLSPSRTLTLVHAVQRPKPPVLLNGDISVIPRAEGETAQTVQANLRFDGASAGRVDLVASWVEYVDSPAADDPTRDPSTNPVARTGAVTTITPNVGDATSFLSARQLFGDTKRRDITFSSVATTRFREYFPASITSSSANITSSATLPSPIICRSSARPPTPRVLYAVPSFAFSAQGSGATATRTRAGGSVRVYVDRGWFASGADERLGVVLAKSDADARNLSSLVSVWGEDPIWFRNKLGALDVGHINTAGVADIAFDVPLAEGAGTVNVATYKPSFNAQRGLWYFDITLNIENSYFPFLRLALVRYQPQSVGSLHMSSVVCTEFVQIAANRTASVVDVGGGKYSVSLSGPTAPNLATVPAGSPAAWASGHFVNAEFQQATTADPDPIDWAVIGTPTTLVATSVSGSNVTFLATMTFPSAVSTPGSKHRILLREYEVYAADAEDGVREGVGVVQVGAPATSYKTRLVYADAVALNV